MSLGRRGVLRPCGLGTWAYGFPPVLGGELLLGLNQEPTALPALFSACLSVPLPVFPGRCLHRDILPRAVRMHFLPGHHKTLAGIPCTVCRALSCSGRARERPRQRLPRWHEDCWGVPARAGPAAARRPVLMSSLYGEMGVG